MAAAWRTQRNFRVHVVLAVLVVLAGAVLRLPAWAWAVLALAIALVVAVELANTALEALVDLVSPGDHPLAKRAKDVAAASVLVTAAGAVAAGASVLVAVLRAR